MNNILCKLGLHKAREVKSTKTTVMKLMEDIIRKESKILLPLNEETICKKFGVDRNTLWIGYDVYDLVCIRPGCNCCDYRVEKKKRELIKSRNFITRLEIKNTNKDRLVEKIYKECK